MRGGGVRRSIMLEYFHVVRGWATSAHHFYIQATGTLVAALADDEDSRAAAEQLYEAATCFLNSVKNIVFVDE